MTGKPSASGGNAAVCHAQIYTMGALLRHGTLTEDELLAVLGGGRRTIAPRQ